MNYYRNIFKNPNEIEPLMSITLDDDTIIPLYTEDDMIKTICNTKRDDNDIIFNNIMFKKVWIKKVNFVNYTLDYIPENFCNSLNNQNIQIENVPEGVKLIKRTYLNNIQHFNQPISFPTTLEAIEPEYIQDLPNFNSDVDFYKNRKLKHLGLGDNSAGGFVNLPKFNRSIDLSRTSIEKIFGSFVDTCDEFNSYIYFPNTLKMIYGNKGVLYKCSKYNKNISIPPNIEKIEYFLNHCPSAKNVTVTIKNATNFINSINNPYYKSIFRYNGGNVTLSGVNSNELIQIKKLLSFSQIN